MLFPKMKLDWMMIGIATTAILGAQIFMAGLPSDLAARPFDGVSQDTIAATAAPSIPAVASSDCPITLDLLEDANAMIGLTLLAPCMPVSDVMVMHAGLVFSAQTMASGSLFLSLPALTQDASVAVRFLTGETAEASILLTQQSVPRRFAVQWPENDGFSLHAFEGGADFDTAGHIWAENLGSALPDQMPRSGYLTLLGDKTVQMPMFAQIYTYAPDTDAEVIVEAPVTLNTCGLDLMGDTISSLGGIVAQDEITVAMPDCSAVGEFVQLIGLAPDRKLALAN